MKTETKSLTDAGKARLVAINDRLNAITAEGFKAEEGGLVVSSDAAEEFKSLIGEQKEIRSHLSGLGEFAELEAYLNAPAVESKSAEVASRARIQELFGGQAEYKSVGQMFVESEEFKGRGPGGGMMAPFEYKGDLGVAGLERKDIYTAAGGTLTHFGFGTVQREPLVPRPYRTQRVRDLFPIAATNANLIEYMRVMGYLGGNQAGMVAERTGDNSNFALKPHTSLQLQPAQAPIRTIAHYEVAHRNTLSDEPQLQSIIDTELLYGLRLMEDDQLLNGDGTGENILGILKTPGVQQYPGVPIPSPSPVLSTDTYVDAIRRAATRVMLAYYEPTGIVVHPFDWERMELTKTTQGEYVVAVNVAIGAQKRLWQMPVIASPAMAQGTALVGAFGLGAKVYDREQSNIRVAEQHADLFLRNAVAILAEERVGMTVSRPESFVKVDLPTGSSV